MVDGCVLMQAMRIVFIDCTKKPYDGDTLRTDPLGGIQSVTVNLAEALAARGHNVRVFNQVKCAKTVYGVDWVPFDHDVGDCDIVVVNNDANLFEKAKGAIDSGARTYLWLHNSIGLIKTVKRKRLGAIFEYRPKAIFLSRNQQKHAGCMLPFRDKTVIPHGIHNDFLLDVKASLNADRPKRAIYFSQPYRGLKEMCELWKTYVHPHSLDSEFHVFGGRSYLVDHGVDIDDYEQCGVVYRERVDKAQLISELYQSRVLLYPGHKDETFCNAAAEAAACGVAVVTQGIGSLKERVVDTKSGFICSQYSRMGERVVEIFDHDDMYENICNYSAGMVKNLNWDVISEQWERDIFCD
ncbi:MAG: glycosyltransferase [Bdellovibrionales bacterium]